MTNNTGIQRSTKAKNSPHKLQNFVRCKIFEPIRPKLYLTKKLIPSNKSYDEMDTEFETVPDDFAEFSATLSLKDPIKEYQKLVDERMKVNAFVPTEMGFLIWDKISAGARESIWKLLFDNSNDAKDHLETAAEFLKLHRDDACFYSPSEYNDWIVTVRDELLKRKMFDFWKNEMVAKELGPAWARDSDLYDDMDDPEPANFYKYAGCEAAWLMENKNESLPVAALNLMTLNESVPPNTLEYIRKISIETPVVDYKYNMGEAENHPDDKVYMHIFREARQLIWTLLFGEANLIEDNLKKASALLVEYKRDACSYSPHEYNDWILKLRDELFKRQYFNFWQQVIVDKQLGLCWAKDCNYFDDMEDPKPLQFYESGIDLLKQENK